jgi:XTP/dITP diphosphohydrolase
MVLTRHEPDLQPLVGEGAWRGELLHAPRARGGFRDDLLFFGPSIRSLARPAELFVARKNRISHRGTVLRRFLTRPGESG